MVAVPEEFHKLILKHYFQAPETYEVLPGTTEAAVLAAMYLDYVRLGLDKLAPWDDDDRLGTATGIMPIRTRH